MLSSRGMHQRLYYYYVSKTPLPLVYAECTYLKKIELQAVNDLCINLRDHKNCFLFLPRCQEAPAPGPAPHIVKGLIGIDASFTRHKEYTQMGI